MVFDSVFCFLLGKRGFDLIVREKQECEECDRKLRKLIFFERGENFGP
jgi:hypothetical protein